jgi:hypothetical protein
MNGDGDGPDSNEDIGYARNMPLPEQSSMPQNPTEQLSIAAQGKEPAQTLTISNGKVAPSLPVGEFFTINLLCEGGAADALTEITASADFVGKKAVLRNVEVDPVTDVVTVTDGTGLLLTSNFFLNAADDVIILECKEANVWREWTKASPS